MSFAFSFLVACWMLCTPPSVVVSVTPTPRLEFPVDNLGPVHLVSLVKNKTVVFLGDSVTRYQYLNLITLLHRSRWPDPFITDEVVDGSVCCEASFWEAGGWRAFYNASNFVLDGNELCDCIKSGKDAIENRHYYNPKLNTTVVFIWLGRSPAVFRPAFVEHAPFDRHCRVSDLVLERDLPMCTRDIFKKLYNNTQNLWWGATVYTLTSSFKPDLFVINWGHHSTFYYQYPKGKQVYNEMKSAVEKLRQEGHTTRFVWKATTPICDAPKEAPRYPNYQCRPTIVRDDPMLVGNRLVADSIFELFDTPAIVKQLRDKAFQMINRTRHRMSGNTPKDWFSETLPLYWDGLHPFCWVHEQFNRALLAQIFLNMSYV